MKHVWLILLLFLSDTAYTQQRLAFTRISTDDGTGLASNVVSCIYQDEKGFIWVGTANGLQRFDGSKFTNFRASGTGDPLPLVSISQIIPADSSKLLLVMANTREFGIYDPSRFTYRKIPLKTAGPIPPRAQFWAWKSSRGEIYLTILRYGLLRYDKKQHAFIDDNSFNLPVGWKPTLAGIYEDTVKKQFWIPCDKGLCIYDQASRQTWSPAYNPHDLPVFRNTKLQDGISEIHIDRQRRIWAFAWPAAGGGQAKYCFDSTGTIFLDKDTAGLTTGPIGYTEYSHFYETAKSGLWVYGAGVLFNWDRQLKRFHFSKSDRFFDNSNIDYDNVGQVMEDKDGSIWVATDRGLYFTSVSSDKFSVVNLIMGGSKDNISITDILEMPNGDLWFASWGNGIKSVDKEFRPVDNYVYSKKEPGWNAALQGTAKLTWALCRQSTTGNVFVGCNEGVLLIHDPLKRTTKYLQPPAFNRSTIRHIAEDAGGNMWFGTQGGRLIKYDNNGFTVVQELGTIIYKVFIDRQGIIWLATHEKGLYAVDGRTGKILQHYTAESAKNNLYSNTGDDIEQLNDSIIVFGAGALNFINKRTGTVRQLTYEEGLPSNNVVRLRMDQKGFLWIITANGLCRYNPGNNRITPFGRKDGIIMAEQTNVADYACSNGNIIFAGNNAVISFHPSVFSNTLPPIDVSITDFKIFNNYIPLDSLLQQPMIKLKYNQNSFTVYFASLSYTQRDKLTYYYKMEGLDKNWIKADRRYYENYSALPPGKYTFKVYCENLEGMRSSNTTEINIYIKPPFWRTWWFITSVLFVIALIIYDIHNARIKRILAVEKLRNRVARDLHDDMGSTLSTINILSSMAKTKMNVDPVKTTEYLSKITDNSQRMMEAMDDIVWSIKPSNDSMQKITARMREFATSVLEAKEIDLDFVVDEKVNDVKLGMEARRDFFLVFKEAVNNAAKYSKATKVTILIDTHGKKLELTVKDNGIGFDVAGADGGNGLGNMRKRADAMNGQVKLRSEQGTGTEVNVTIPFL